MLIRRAHEVTVCPGCGAEWCRVLGKPGREMVYCSRNCKERHHYQTRPELREKIVRNSSAAYKKKKEAARLLTASDSSRTNAA